MFRAVCAALLVVTGTAPRAKHPNLTRADPAAVVAFTPGAGPERLILRFEGHTFPYLLRNGIPVPQGPALPPSAEDRVPCRTAKGAGWVNREALERHLRAGAWPEVEGTAVLGLLVREGGRWTLVTEGPATPLAGPATTAMKPGRALVLGHTDNTIMSTDQRDETFLVVEKWVLF